MSPNAFQRRQKARARLPQGPASPPPTQQANDNSNPAAPSPETTQTRDADLCQFPFSDGRHCRMPRWHQHDLYCLYHAREEEPLLGADQVAEELVSLSGDFKTANDVNHVLGKLFYLRAKNKISRRDAVALTYMAQLMLQSLPGVRREIISYDMQGWESTLEAVFAANAAEHSQNQNDAENHS